KEMVVFWKMKAGAHATMHQHPHEQIFWMISGKMEFNLAGEKRTCVAGDLGLIPGNTPHEAFFVEDTEGIDIFAPPREDMFTGGGTDLPPWTCPHPGRGEPAPARGAPMNRPPPPHHFPSPPARRYT